MGHLKLKVYKRLEEVIDEKTGETSYELRRYSTNSNVTRMLFTLASKVEGVWTKTGNSVEVIEAGDQIELSGTENHPTIFNIIRTKVPETSLHHRSTISFRRISEIRFRKLN